MTEQNRMTFQVFVVHALPRLGSITSREQTELERAVEIEPALSKVGPGFSCWKGEVRDWIMVFVDFDI